MANDDTTIQNQSIGVLRSLGLSGWKVSNDVSMVSFYLLIFFLGGLALVTIEEWRGKPYTALLWSLACFSVGAIVGFLFGIPRVLQQDGATATVLTPAGAAAASPAVASAYSLRVNTNLEQISDWLTKIFVGLGLVQLQRVPDHLNRASTFVAYGLGSGSKFFAGALIVYFSILGFLGFYLITRLYIAGAFGRADQQASQKLEDRIKVENIEVGPESEPLTDTDRKAALNWASEKRNEVLTTEELAVRAKALLSLRKYAQAAELYKELLKAAPDDVRLRYEYSLTLFYLGNEEEAYKQLLEVYQRIGSVTDRVFKRNIYRSLTFQALYQPPPRGFEDAIRFGEEYTSDPQNDPNPGIWTNLAAAYGQRTAWLKQHAPDDASQIEQTRERALAASQHAVQFGERWKQRIQELMVKGYPNKDPRDNDLETFEDDKEFRNLAGLPPK